MNAVSSAIDLKIAPPADRDPSDWSFARLQLVGWGAYFVLHSAGGFSEGEPPSMVFYSLTNATAALVFTSLMALILRRFWLRPAPVAAGAALLVSFLFAMPFSLISEQAYFLARGDGWRLDNLIGSFGSALWCGSVLLTWTALWFGIEYYRQAQEAKTAAATAAAAATQARLNHLTSQLNPHFLFNTLNTLSTLVLTGRNQPAAEVIDGLADLLRASLEGDGRPLVTLEEELELARAYLAIERVRYGDRLRFGESIDPSMLTEPVPRLILQPLIENAVRYAVAPSHDGATITVAARRAGETFELVVADDGAGAKAEQGHGIGLSNVAARLRTLFGDRATVQPTQGDGFAVRLQWRPVDLRLN